MTVRVLPGADITDWASFHRVSASVFGFPEFYGANSSAWIDCLTYIHEGDGMSNVVLHEDELLHIHVVDAQVWAGRSPDTYLDFLELVAFVNLRALDAGQTPRLSLVLR